VRVVRAVECAGGDFAFWGSSWPSSGPEEFG
jgi:hypothetical protein